MEVMTRPAAFATIPVTCIMCGEITDIELNLTNYFAWRGGAGTIQKMLPDLTTVEREMLVTGLCEKHQIDGE